MGNCVAPCKTRKELCITDVAAKPERVLQVVKMDGKVLEFSMPTIVKDILVNFSGTGIGLSKEASEHLPPNYELKMGKVYYMLPADISSTPDDVEKADRGVKRIKIVITKQQLQDLLTKQISVEDVLLGLEKRTCDSLDSPKNWKPKLESIPEGSE
ncbi:hypothetical protein FH972_016172 [Carpinus fangiana]|uniref:Uncharacterized protein n=1 Tax=Carpinus fangiana TaxID=176857 RepID=A0A5N6RF31_9ROSI|nr:hypothetical protein FH972_016172 [Carpinus fangiana]